MNTGINLEKVVELRYTRRMADIEKIISKKIARAIMKYKMIEEGDRILLAVSGGKDSMTLFYHLLKKQKAFPINFDLKGLHIKTDFCNCFKKTKMETKIEEWDAPFEIKQVGVLKRLKPGRKMNCYWCSTQRRTELMNYAKENGFNKIALGHHMDDIIETFLMNMFYKSELSTMLPVLKYDNYPQTVIRPLALVKEDEVRKFAEKLGISQLVCKCKFGQNSKRKDVRKFLDEFTQGEDFLKDNVYKAMGNARHRYLLSAMEEANFTPTNSN